jgi:hypothetical protein
VPDVEQDTERDGPFVSYCEDNAPVWKMYMDQAKIFDDGLANGLNSGLDPLLIFVRDAFLFALRHAEMLGRLLCSRQSFRHISSKFEKVYSKTFRKRPISFSEPSSSAVYV